MNDENSIFELFKPQIENITNQLKFLKENLNLILLIPTILGGFWQLFELSLISTEYIRFFSISQMIPDGLMILFILLLCYSAYNYKSPEGNTDYIKDMDRKELKPLESQNYLTRYILGVLFVIGGVWVLYKFLIPEMLSINEKFALGKLMMIIIVWKFVSPFIIFPMELLMNKIPKLKNTIKPKLARLKLLVLIPIFIYLIIIARNSYTYPNNMINFKKIEHILKTDYSILDTTEILYMNDKYIFIKLINTSNEYEVVILETKVLFSILAN